MYRLPLRRGLFLMTSIPRVQLRGLLGDALAANHAGRLTHFIVDETSPAIAIFSPEHRLANVEGDWYGEHAGKWLYAAAKAAARTGDTALLANIRRVADYLIGEQEADGYLGTYAPERRFMREQPAKPGTWDGAPALRTWDVWTHAYLILGLLEVHRHFPTPLYLEAARKIGGLCWRTLGEGGIDITELGNHHGMSATVLMDPALELYFATGERRYLELALLIVKQADRNPELGLLTRALAGADASEIGTGKAYQLLWNLVGIAKLHKATGAVEYRHAVERLWHNIREQHLTLGGGPWGGVGHRSREVFNPAGFFSPHGYVETCSVLAWIQLNRELLAISGDAKYADEIERAAYNDLLGAMAPDGENWCYYSFPNGRRVHTTWWRCCKSSGAMALEELPDMVYGISSEGNITINLFGPGEARLTLPQAGIVILEQITAYPFDGAIRIHVNAERAARFTVFVRIPAWASESTVEVIGVDVVHVATPGSYAAIEREWRTDDEILLHFPMPPVVHRKLNQSIQQSRVPGGSPVRQQVMRYEYLGLTRGPLAYATSLIDGFKTGETIRPPQGPSDAWLEVVASPSHEDGPAIRMNLGYRSPITFVPYYRAGGRSDGAWRLTWMSVAPDSPTLAD